MRYLLAINCLTISSAEQVDDVIGLGTLPRPAICGIHDQSVVDELIGFLNRDKGSPRSFEFAADHSEEKRRVIMVY